MMTLLVSLFSLMSNFLNKNHPQISWGLQQQQEMEIVVAKEMELRKAALQTTALKVKVRRQDLIAHPLATNLPTKRIKSE